MMIMLQARICSKAGQCGLRKACVRKTDRFRATLHMFSLAPHLMLASRDQVVRIEQRLAACILNPHEIDVH